jgi:hypothetical protein
MASETETIVAFVFNRSGKKEMAFSEFYLTLSIELNWFTPEDAKTFTKNAVKQKILTEEKEIVKPGFNTDEIKIPIGFYPSKKVFKNKEKKDIKNEKKEENLLQIIIQRIAKKSNLDEKTIIKQVKKIEQEKNITTKVAALLVGKEYDIVFEDLLNLENYLLN